MPTEKNGQNLHARTKNKDYFLNNIDKYASNVALIDTYKNIFDAINGEIEGLCEIVDIGAGGVFDYDTTLVKKIIGVDLFLDDIKNKETYPPNIFFAQGDALSLNFEDNSVDNVIIVFLLHHLVGNDVKSTYANMKKSVSEAHRVLKPGGKFILVESCVPKSFVLFEKLVYLPASWMIRKILSHPPTFQVSDDDILSFLSTHFKDTKCQKIEKGKFILQLGFKVPSWLTPAQPFIFVAQK